MKVKVLGASHEVGRSGFLVSCDGTNFLLDYGVMFGKRGMPPQYPLHVKPKDVDSVIITHAHLDHSGNVPSLFVSRNTDVFATPPTFDLSQLLIEDMLKIEKGFHQFDLPEINNMMRNAKEIGYKQKISRSNASFELRESGHVLGGSTVVVESENKRLFYTGDINPRGSRMLREADLDIGEIDLLITESTYSQTEQMPRKESEEGLIEFANEVVDRKGILFIPSFSVERSQEIACVLKNAKFKHKIIMDGMALKVNEIMFRYPEYLKDPELFADSINSTVPIRNQHERKKALEEPCVVISPAGMLVGGNAVYYLQQLAFDNKNGIALVSYQGDGTPGKKLQETGKVSTRGHDMKVSAEVKQFEFSGHGDRNDLFDLIKNIKGNPKVLTVHGDNDSCIKFAEEITEKFDLEAHSPQANEVVEV
ncbi:MAG: putative Beta-lactamase domain-containing protein, mRNA 3-end processing factor [Nitrosopumilales archaeon]|nr:MAG: putative Beta-lactamase domain-containing protein, mRNA 3-end processing factor [Nitrosopumilales archaeon]